MKNSFKIKIEKIKAWLFNKNDVFLQSQDGHHYAFVSTLTSHHFNNKRTFQLSNVRM